MTDDYDEYEDPPCACWCEFCGCHGYCEDNSDEEEGGDE